MDEMLDEDYSSNSDSMVMGVLRSAMDRAHEEVQCKDGPIGFLHERSKFYEVAAILVDAGMNIVQEETDILESSREKIRLDLMEIEHWLHGRIKQMKLLIVDKDKELKERVETEVKLRKALELKEKELVLLRAKKKFKQSKSENFLDYIIENHENCESMNLQGEEEFSRIDSVRPENIVNNQMSSDVDMLKGTLNLAFGRMQKAEVHPLQKQWRWTIENDIISILIRGFISDIKRTVEAEREDREFESLIRDDIFQFIVVEVMKDAHESENLSSPIRLEVYDQEESFIDSLLMDDEKKFNPVLEKLEGALDQLRTSRTLVSDLACSLENCDDRRSECSEVTGRPDFSLCRVEDSEAAPQSWPLDIAMVFSPPVEFEQLLANFEETAHEKVERNSLRIKELKQKLATLVPPIISVREEKLIYKKAFFTRCHNLELAEAEVDQLGDQVDRLLHLLEKIYVELDRNSKILPSNIGVSDVLKLIKKELVYGVADTTQL